jgi:hypothetical protein
MSGLAIIFPQRHETIYGDLPQASSDRPNHPSFSQSSRHTLKEFDENSVSSFLLGEREEGEDQKVTLREPTFPSLIWNQPQANTVMPAVSML